MEENEYIKELAGVVALPDYMSTNLMEFARRIKIQIKEEQRKPNPNNALIALLCDSARLGYELLDAQAIIIEKENKDG